MRKTIDERIINQCKATLVFDTGGPVGSDHLMIIKPTDTESDWLINRWFYFDEQVKPYMWNFAEKICSDAAYRQRSRDRTADWARVADLYESFARKLYEELSHSERSDFPILNDDSRKDSEKLHSLCNALFEELRSTIRQETAHNPETIYDKKRAELQEWLADESS